MGEHEVTIETLYKLLPTLPWLSDFKLFNGMEIDDFGWLKHRRLAYLSLGVVIQVPRVTFSSENCPALRDVYIGGKSAPQVKEIQFADLANFTSLHVSYLQLSRLAVTNCPNFIVLRVTEGSVKAKQIEPRHPQLVESNRWSD